MDVVRRSKMRAMTLRLFAGDVRPSDLMELFTCIRFRADYHHLVREVGDFIAHIEGRNQGYVNKVVEERTAFWHFRWWRQANSLTHELMPREAIDLLFLSKQKADQRAGVLINTLYEKNLKKQKNAFLRKYENVGNEILKLAKPLNDFEISLICAGISVGDTDFSSVNLTDQFFKVLLKNQLIEHAENFEFLKIEHKLSLFVASIMHGAIFKSKRHGDIMASVGRGVRSDDGMIVINGSFKDDTRFPNRTIGMTFPLFITRAAVDEWATDVGSLPICDFALELDENFHFRRLPFAVVQG